MLRVISGSAGGIFLQTAKGPDVRPTQDRVKQSLFSGLGEKVVDADVLDLYAGTGALGIESLSRGAKSCIFVEQNFKCVAAIKENLKRCKLQGTVINLASEKWLSHNTSTKFDLIFVDPPYHQFEGPLQNHPLWAAAPHLLKPKGLIVFEHFFKHPLELPAPFEIIHQKRYGDTFLSWVILGKDEKPEPPSPSPQ